MKKKKFLIDLALLVNMALLPVFTVYGESAEFSFAGGPAAAEIIVEEAGDGAVWQEAAESGSFPKEQEIEAVVSNIDPAEENGFLKETQAGSGGGMTALAEGSEGDESSEISGTAEMDFYVPPAYVEPEETGEPGEGEPGEGEPGEGEPGEEEIVPVNLSDCKINTVSWVFYTGSAISPEVIVTAPDNTVLQEDVDYKLAFSNNINPGTAKINITAVGEKYSGAAEVTFLIMTMAPELISAQSKGYQSIEISWKPVQGATSYILYYKGNGITSYKQIKAGITGTSYIHKSSKKFPIVTGKKYTYTVRSVYGKEVGAGAYNKNGIKGVAKPGAPLMQSGNAVDSDTVTLSWSKVDGATGYRLYYSNGKQAWKAVKTVKGENSYTFNGNSKTPIIAGVTYKFKTIAYRTVNGKNVYGDYSPNEIKLKTSPDTVQLTGGECIDEGKIRITWKKANGANQYIVYRKTANTNWVRIATLKGADKTSYTHVSSSQFPIKDGQTYWYTVRSYTTKGKTWGGYDKNGVRVETLQGTPEEISAKKNARRIAAQITNDGMSRSEKLQTCFNWVMYGNYKIWRTPSLYKGWAAEFANDHFERNRLGCCISDACAFAYLAWAIGYTDVYVCLDSSTDMANTHAWTEVDGLVYDPLFAQAKSYANNYGVSYGTYGLSAEYKEKIK